MAESAGTRWRDRFDGRTFVGLLLAGLVGVLAVVPYQFALTGWPAAELLPVVLAATLVQNGVLIGLSVLLGLVLGAAIGFRVYAPAVIPGATFASKYGKAIVVGLGFGVVVILADVLVFAPLVRDAVLGGAVLPAQPSRGEAAWLGLLASLYGGVTEELFLRFGLMSALAWVGWRLAGRPAELPQWVAWGAILVAALLFAVGHLGATAAVFELTPAVLVRMIVLNGLGGVAFGWLYWRYDLVSAMVAHFAGDVVIHVLAVFLA